MAQPNILVIGTGFGGAVTACRLAQAGLAVTVLERGRRYDGDRAGFPRGPLHEWLWGPQRGLFDIKPLSEMQVVTAAGFGGGSLIYANVQLRPPPEIFESGWPDGYSREALDPYFDLVAWMLDIRPITDSPRGMPTKTQRTGEAAAGLGRQGAFFHPPIAVNFSEDPELVANRHGVMQGGCTHCGECVIGCQVRAKNTLDLNYLAVAERMGAEMRTECEVTHIEAKDEGGYRVHFRDHQQGGTPAFADASHVFVCAGAIHSTALLLQSRALGGLSQLSDQLGLGYSGNGDMLAFSFDTSEPWAPDQGPTITTALRYDRPEAETRGWFLIEEGGFPRQLAALVDLVRPTQRWLSSGSRAPAGGPESVSQQPVPPSAAEIAEVFRATAEQTLGAPDRISPEGEARMKNTAMFLGMGRDLANGRIELLPGEAVTVRWDVPSNLPLYSLQERVIQDLAEQLGGSYGANPFWRLARVPISVHNLGGCSMGQSPDDGVTDEGGEVFGHPNLFVMDGAIVPSAIGVNPAHTIAAVAERNIERFIRKITGDASWTPPERLRAKPFADPHAAPHLAASMTAPPTRPPLGLRFHERLDGTWTVLGTAIRRPATYSLQMTIGDVASFIADEAHLAVPNGTIRIDGLTAGDTEVRGGLWNLLVPHGDGSEREIRYVLPFQAADGRRCTLVGVKVFRPNPGLALWKENTTLDFQIHEGNDARGAVLGGGELHIGISGIVDFLASFEEFGPYPGFEKARALLDFFKFYLGTVAEVSWLGGLRQS